MIRPDRIVAFGLTLLVVSTISVVMAAGEEPTEPSVRIGVVTDGPRARGFDLVELLKPEIEQVTGGSYTVEFVADGVLDGGWDRAGIDAALDELFQRSDLDLVLAVGVESAAAVCAREDLPVSVVVPFAFAECIPGCTQSPKLRINAMRLGQLMMADLNAFREVVSYSQVAVLTEPSWIAGCNVDRVAVTFGPEGATVRFVPVKPGDTDVLDDLPEGTDAVYLMRLQQVDDEGFRTLVQGLTDAGIPTFSMIGEMEVRQGVLAGLNTMSSINTLVRGAAVDVLDSLDGRDSTPEPYLDYGARLTVNMATASDLDLGVSWEVLSDAQLLNEDVSRRGEAVDLEAALDRAVEANLDLLVQDRVVAAGEEDIREARSNFRPHVDVSVLGAAIDSDRAFAALGQYERWASGSAELTQLIYSDRASANVMIQKEIQKARRADRETVRFDITRAAATAYMNLMRTEALVRIRQDDVDLNRANLNVARLRHSVGAAGTAEIYRWEAQLAAARAALLEAHSTRRLAERQLSRLLDRPVMLQWRPRAPGLEEGLRILGGVDTAPLLDNPNGFEQLTTDLLAQGLEASPELTAIDAAIAAQHRAYTAAKRRYYAPDVALAAGVGQIVAKYEGDEDSGGFPPGLLPDIDDTVWNLGVKINLPVVTGGANKARRIRADEELRGLRLQRRNVNLKISQRILSALDIAAASWPAISLRRQSAEAAAQTLRLVQDAYGRGAASILALLDAQNAALTAEFAAETAVYDFLDDWAEVQRSIADL